MPHIKLRTTFEHLAYSLLRICGMFSVPRIRQWKCEFPGGCKPTVPNIHIWQSHAFYQAQKKEPKLPFIYPCWTTNQTAESYQLQRYCRHHHVG
jgi:hypothetical protein